MIPTLPNPPRPSEPVRSEPAKYRLDLTSFRCHDRLTLTARAPLAMITGPNGIGKTAILEALSLLAPGRGLRQALPADLAQQGSPHPWLVRLWVPDSQAQKMDGTGAQATGPHLPDSHVFEPQASGPHEGLVLASGVQAGRRRAWAGENPLPSVLTLTDWVRISWPVAGLCGGATDRRLALDRLILTLDPSYGPLAIAYDKALRQRNLLLAHGERDNLWYESLELQLAKLGLVLMAKRTTHLAQLAREMSRHITPLAWPTLTVSGPLEEELDKTLPSWAGAPSANLGHTCSGTGSAPADPSPFLRIQELQSSRPGPGALAPGSAESERQSLQKPPSDQLAPLNPKSPEPGTGTQALEVYKRALARSRSGDLLRKTTSLGPHKTKIHIIHPNGREGPLCSAGEQKALVLSTALATLRLAQQTAPHHPHFFLLDEALAFLDQEKQSWLWDELRALAVFCLLTGLPHTVLPADVQQMDVSQMKRFS